MPRVKKSSAEKLNDSINVPLNRKFKKRFVEKAKAEGQKPTRYARQVLESHMAPAASA